MRSNYQVILEQVKDLKCSICMGAGSVCYSGDPKYNSITCDKCYGTGWRDGVEKRKLVRI